MDGCASRLETLICCQIILTASSPGSLLICPSLAIRLIDLPPLVSLGDASEVRRLLLDLDPYGGTDTLGMFPPRHGVVFRRLVRLVSFPGCWRQTNVTLIPKGPPSSSAANYRPFP